MTRLVFLVHNLSPTEEQAFFIGHFTCMAPFRRYLIGRRHASGRYKGRNVEMDERCTLMEAEATPELNNLNIR